MKAKVKQGFIDKYSEVKYEAGMEIEVTPARALEILQKGALIEVKEEDLEALKEAESAEQELKTDEKEETEGKKESEEIAPAQRKKNKKDE